jgi:glycerol transport system permease protein
VNEELRSHEAGEPEAAWLLILPVVLCVAFSAILPLMTVVNYSVQDIISPERRVFVGTEWFKAVMRDDDLHSARCGARSFFAGGAGGGDPAGHRAGAVHAGQGWKASAVLVTGGDVAADPVERGGHHLADLRPHRHRPAGRRAVKLGIDYSYTGNATDAWLTVLLMDVWHWTPLVALLCYAGLRSIPDAYYQAARIDGASKLAVFRYIQLPKMRGVLMIAVLLRFMDSFMIYTEPFVLTGGGPGNATTFLSQYLTQKAVGQFDLGPAAAFSLIYFLIILLLCFILYNWMQRVGTADKDGGHDEPRFKKRTLFLIALPRLRHAAGLLDGQHVASRPTRRSCRASALWPQHFTWTTTRPSSPIRPGTRATSTRLIYVAINTVISLTVALPAAYAFSRYRSSATSMCSSGC